MMSTKLHIAVLTALTGAASSLAVAAPPSTSPYVTDSQSSYVQDATSDSIGQVNMITCVFSSMRADALVNQGPYVALIDKNKCDATKSGASTSSTGASAAQAPNYMTAVVDSTRASNTAPMLVKAWISIDQEGQPVTIFAHVSATEAPSTSNPYGAFRLDYCGKPDGGSSSGCMMNGYMQGAAGGLSYYETDSGGGSQITQLQLSSVGTTTGSGSLSIQQSGGGGGGGGGGGNSSTAFNFAYDSHYFLRQDPSSGSQCFSRDATDPGTGFAVWQYGLYDSTTGARIERNSGFPIQYTSGGTMYQGYLGYYGLQLPAEAMATLVSGTSSVQKADYQNAQNGATPVSASYTVVTGGGRLMRYTKKTRTLDGIDQIHFNAWVGAAGGSGLPDSNTQYDMYWDNASDSFIATAENQCGQNGCQSVNLSSNVSVAPSFWSNVGGVQGWSQSLGGDVFVDLHNLSGTIVPTATNVVYHVQDLVYPDDSTKPTALYCVNNCPTLASLHSYFTQDPSNPTVASPYAGGTYNSSQPAPSYTTYSVDANASLNSAGGPVVDTTAADYQQFPQYQNGVMSGRLFVNPTDAVCDVNANPVQYCDWAVNAAAVYYVWQTGSDSWNQFSAVKDSVGAFVHFDAPLQVSFHVPNDSSFGSYRGTSLILQYNNFGDLWGIPGNCVSPTTNVTEDCNISGARYVPQFVIPYDPTATPQQGVVTTTSNGISTTYLVKWLQREIRFAVNAASVCTNDNLQPPTNVPLPTATGLQDPGSSSSTIYLGAKPTVVGAPRVIQGKVEY